MSEVFKHGNTTDIRNTYQTDIHTQKKIGKVDEEKDSHLHSSNPNHAYWRITETKRSE